MSVLGIVRADSVNLPLFVHVLGAMALVGALVFVAFSLASAWRGAEGAAVRAGYRSLLLAALPAYIVMRVGAEWVTSEQFGDSTPNWVDMGYMIADPTLLLLIIATVLAGIGARRAATTAGDGTAVVTASPTLVRISVVLVGISLAAYVFAIWAMTTKPT
jgi:uncharacterized membrane protein